MNKRYLVLIALILFALSSQITSCQETSLRSPETWLLGYFDQDALLMEPHDKWFNDEFDEYQLDSEAFMELESIDTDNMEIVIVLGTWCPDSRREVPRFNKILQSWGFPEQNITLIGVDSYKVAPVEDFDKLNIERVPTFIFYINKVEVGRIIEYPVSSLERDMVKILSGK